MIELLIVMLIIGILATISIFALNGVRSSGRDAVRKANLETISSALEMYKADCGTYPPPSGNSVGSSITGDGSVGCPASNVYLDEAPQDPLGGDYYYNRPTSSTFILCSTLENPPSPANNTTGCGSCAGGACEYKVVNP